ncbi:alpha/beta hydrolase [Luteolibacter sp. GHJ8]|uniref:Alpha/beta hydrolase n=1 Tax=Luteolibacter rhizosphaerae TaxID=2989719 RepID=A0ABT3G8X8_9BACT|nr:alpha/beta hydrolase [Luteolibacter rhizosphaerae]MCW1916082.1 alpha/beta hydrolase [Luteolibacter rhizosphaerae]
MLLVVPEFDRVRFDVEAYQEGGVMRKGKLQPKAQWTFNYLAPLLAQVFEREGRDLPYYLVGHSAGAQFLGRMAALYPNEAKRMVLVNPGSLIFPDRDQAYPYGFGGLPDELASDTALRRYLAAPLTLYLGTGDVGLKDLSTGKRAMRQGPTRIERGRNCHEEARQLAETKAWALSWKRVEAEGLDHGSRPMWEHANCRLAILGEVAEETSK